MLSTTLPCLHLESGSTKPTQAVLSTSALAKSVQQQQITLVLIVSEDESPRNVALIRAKHSFLNK